MTDLINRIEEAREDGRGLRHLEILQHALGTDQFGRGTMYRDHFVTGEGSTDYPDCMALTEMGLMERRGFSALTGGDWCFIVTDAGKQFVRENSPKVTAKQRAKDRYSKFLDLRDVCPDLTFRDFLNVEARHDHRR